MAFYENERTTKYQGEYVIGFDLTDTYSQISFGSTESEEVNSFSMIAGGDDYLIPTILYKRREVSQWYVGKEALNKPQADGFIVDKLVTKALETDEIVIGEETYRVSAIIALFMKRLLSMVNYYAPLNKVASVMITVDALNDRIIKTLTEAVKSLGLKTENIYFQNHMESFYFYTIYQPRELWNREVLLVDFTSDVVKTYRMECNNRTTPIVAFIDPEVYSNIYTIGLQEMLPDTRDAKHLDEELLLKLNDTMHGRVFSSVYFVGTSFRQDIFKESVKYLCQKGRVFEGNNLYAKGACYGAKNKIVKTILSESHVFLGNDKLKSNVGINVLNRGEKAYLPLLDAGVNWFEAKKECDLYLNLGNKLSFVVTPLTGKNPEVVDITLFDLPKRPQKATRIHVNIEMIAESKMQVKIKDLGFGELFPASDIEWNEVINL